MESDTTQVSTVETAPSSKHYWWREVVIIASILMEITWSVLWYRILISAVVEITFFQAFAIFGGVLIGLYLITRLLNHLNVAMIWRRIILGGMLIINMVLGLALIVYRDHSLSLQELIISPIESFKDRTILLPIDYIILLAILLVSWRGISRLGIETDPGKVTRRFKLGIIMFFAYGIIQPFAGRTPSLALYSFIFLSLMALSASRINALLDVRGGQKIHFDFQWLLGITVFILAIVGLAAVGVSLIREPVLNSFSSVLYWLAYAVVILISPISLLFVWLMYLLMERLTVGSIFEILAELFANIRDMIMTILFWLGALRTGELPAWFENLGDLKPYLLWGSVILVLVIILVALRRISNQDSKEDEQEIELSMVDEDLFGLLRQALRKGWDRFAEGLDRMMRFDRINQLHAAARIRRVYAQLMRLSARLGYARPPSKTPLEFLPQLAKLFPEHQEDLLVITKAYLLVRYGELPDAKADVERVETAWQRISDTGKLKIRAHKGIAT